MYTIEANLTKFMVGNSVTGKTLGIIGIGFLSGLAPDLDIFIRSESDPLLFLEFHRQFTHSLIFIPFVAFPTPLLPFLFNK